MYEINVSFKGKHFFATHERSLTSPDAAKAVLMKLLEAFPAEEGYDVSLSMKQNSSRSMNVQDFLFNQACG